MTRRRLLQLLCVFVLLEGLGLLFLNQNRLDKEERHFAQASAVLATAYRSSIAMYRLTMETTMAEVIARPDVLALFAKAGTATGSQQDVLRGRLYALLRPVYDSLAGRSVRHLQFHLPTGDSFLRFHQPDRYGDSLFEIRPSIRIVNTEHRPVQGFEAGRLMHGYRFVYPLTWEGRHIGSVETNVPFSTLRNAMGELDPEREFAFYVWKPAADAVVFDTLNALYAPSPIHPELLVEDPDHLLPTAPPPPSAVAARINAQLRTDAKVRARMSGGTAFTVRVAAGGGLPYTASFLPVSDVTGRLGGYIVAYGAAPFAAALMRDFLIEAAALTLLLAAALAMFARMQRSTAALAHEKNNLKAITDTMADGLYVQDAAGRVVMTNPAASRMLGRPAEEIVGRIAHDLFHRHDGNHHQPMAECPVFRAISAGRTFRDETQFAPRGGALLPVELISVPLFEEGALVGSVAVFRDIAARKEAETRLRLAASVFAHSHDGIMICDRNSRIIEVNAAFTLLTGWSREEAIGHSPALLHSGRHDADFYRDLWRGLLANGHWRGEVWNRRKDGEVFAELLTISAITGEDGETTHYVGLFSDITAIKRTQAELEHLAHYDALTHLPNRVLLLDRLHQAIAQAKRRGSQLAVCYLDVDGFKPFNDRYGHRCGDQLLVEMAERLTDSLRGEDTVARLGGDEFVLLLNDLADEREAEGALRRILRIVADPYAIEGASIHLTASIGVTVFPGDDGDPDMLIRHADQAMYLTKEAGRNGFTLFDPALNQKTREHLDIRWRLRQALENSEFVLYYQPKVSLREGTVVGMEALLRWSNPELGVVPPGQFLPAIENDRLIVEIGDFVLREAMRQTREWDRLGLDFHISVNISAKQLQQADFVERLTALMAEYPDLPRRRLEIEILETVALDDILHVNRVIRACDELGIDFALDDFGTGYSSLAYFKRLPAKTLKIDQIFIRDMIVDPDALAIVEGVIGLTIAFQRLLVAEGVETDEHGVLLARLGCEVAQGFSIARPMPAAEVPNWVANFRAHPEWSRSVHKRWSREDFPLLAAAVEHRRWLSQLLAALDDGRLDAEAVKAISSQQNRFDDWYAGHGRTHYDGYAEFHRLKDHHDAIHATTAALVEALAVADVPAVQSLTARLRTQSEDLLAALAALQQRVSEHRDLSVAV
ncbi:MAG: EAL domain-containing protein [Magnetospirillum sp.]|nr:EAL domain-containing protein [Magnetospirillum sp.]